ncbi:site-2 protease family protein, partial [Calditerricola satsumensis]
MNAILAIALVFGALVFFHELGHFLLAKRAGILVREFAIGFGPRLVAFRKGETTYSLRLFPLGGYVRMAGEDPEMVPLATGRKVHVRVNGQGQVTDIYLERPEGVPHAMPVTVQVADLERALTLTVEEPDGTVRRYPVHPQAHLHDKGRAVQIAPLDRQFGSKTLGQRFATIVAGPVANLLLAVVLFFAFALMTPAVTGRPVVGDVEPGLPAAKAG